MDLTTYNNIKYFQSELLKEHNFIHAFFTKRLEKNQPSEIQNELNLTSNIHYLNQLHSNKVFQIHNNLDLKTRNADCLITKEKFKSLWIYTADCIPILIADIHTRHIAACHVGFQGLKKQIISRMLERFIKIGSNKNNLIFALGPSINGDNYQLNTKDIEDLLINIEGNNFTKKSCYSIELNNEEIVQLYKKDSTQNKSLFDIQAAAILQLNQEGIKKSQINVNRLCTYSNPNLFNSFRRDKSSLRQWSCIYS